MKKKVVIYARFSSHTQTDQSIEGQLRECYSFAEGNDYVLDHGDYICVTIISTNDEIDLNTKFLYDETNNRYLEDYEYERYVYDRDGYQEFRIVFQSFDFYTLGHTFSLQDAE